jgi:hypothetical protein
MKFEGFNVVDFPPPRVGFVYVFFWVADGVEIPFYVGETDRFQGRMNDYWQAQFAAPTDFKVGEAAKYLKEVTNCRIVVKYKRSADQKAERCKEEDAIKQRLRSEGVQLLDDVPGYKYGTTSKEERSARILRERDAVRGFCDMLIRTRTGATSGD